MRMPHDARVVRQFEKFVIPAHAGIVGTSTGADPRSRGDDVKLRYYQMFFFLVYFNPKKFKLTHYRCTRTLYRGGTIW